MSGEEDLSSDDSMTQLRDPQPVDVSQVGRQAPALEACARRLEQHPDYRVLRRLPTCFTTQAKPAGGVASALLVDTETTGLNPEVDELIELGLVRFEFDTATGLALRVVQSYDGLEQPAGGIPPGATRIHGITEAMVSGQRIDDARVNALLRGVSLVIAHNATFDRQFVEKRLPQFRSVPWSCSLKEIPWAEEGFGSAKLDYLLGCIGFFHEAHRAEADCMALLHILQYPLPVSGVVGMQHLLRAQQTPGVKIWARNSPFDNKDQLKTLGYRWDAAERCWVLETTRMDLEEDLSRLKQSGYNGKAARVELETRDALTRYSNRPGERSQRLI